MRRPSPFRLAVLACASTLFALPAGAQEPEPSSSASGPYASAVERIEHDAPIAMKAQHTPGMAIALTDRRGTLAILTFGDADVATHAPVTPQTRFGIGSITKSMTAIALLQARDRGAFDPQAPVTRYLPWFHVQTRWRALTGHDLLTHTSGLPDGGYGYGAPYDVAALRELETGFAPGSHWSYSNLGYETLGTIVAAVDREPWATVVQRDVIARLGMQATRASWSFETLANAATGYLPREDDRVPDPRNWDLLPVPLTEFTDPAGSVLSTPGDMARYARMILNAGVTDDGTRILSPRSYRLLVSPAATAGTPSVPGLYQRYAYGLAVRTLDGDTVVGHTGGTTPYTACMEADLTAGFAAVALTNVGYISERPCGIVDDALRVLRAAAKHAALPAFTSPPAPEHVAHPERYAGTYAAPNGDRLVVGTDGSDRLSLTHGDATTPLVRAGSVFYAALPAARLSGVRFVIDPKTKRADQLVADGVWYAGAAYHGTRSFTHPAAYTAYVGHYRAPGAHPWDPSVRVQIVKGRLVLDDGTPLVPTGRGTFRIGEEAWSPERLTFDSVIDGHAQRATETGVGLYRVETP